MPEIVKSQRQTIISYLILFLLILVAVAVGVKQQLYERFVPEGTILSDGLFSDDFTAAGDIETCNSNNLYEKIDFTNCNFCFDGFQCHIANNW